MLIYLLMALVLSFRPAGLFPAQGPLSMTAPRQRPARLAAPATLLPLAIFLLFALVPLFASLGPKAIC